VHHLGSLSDDTAVDHSLVIRLNRSRMVQNNDFSLEIEHRCWLGILVNEDHTLSELIALELLFFNKSLDAEADSLASNCAINLDSLIMNCTNLHWFELACLIWA